MSSLTRMGRAVATRAAILAVSLLVASILVFLACAALPGDVAQVILGQNADPAAVAALRTELGTDRPLIVQYGDWMGGLVRGDLGRSYLTGSPVTGDVAPRLGVTVWLVTGGMTLALLLAIPLGVLAAAGRRTFAGFAISALSQIGLAVPAFWAGIVLVVLFAVTWGWLPANGYVPLRTDPGEWFRHLLLPVLSLALVQSAVLVRYIRSAVIEVLQEDHLRTARAVGWGRWAALVRHGLRNASIQVVTVLGLQLSTLLVGAIVVEQVFTLGGLGTRLLTAVAERDLIVVQGVVLMLVTAVLLVNFLVDLSYLALDPRLRASRSRR